MSFNVFPLKGSTVSSSSSSTLRLYSSRASSSATAAVFSLTADNLHNFMVGVLLVAFSLLNDPSLVGLSLRWLSVSSDRKYAEADGSARDDVAE